MNAHEATDFLDKLVHESQTITGWRYLELFDDDFHVDIESTGGVIKAHFLLDAGGVNAFLKTETQFVKVVGTSDDLVSALHALS